MEDSLPSSSNHHVSSNNYTENSGSLVLPKQLENIKASTEFPLFRHRWNTNEEIASILISFSRHKEWMYLEMKVRPPSGSMILYSRNKVRYRKDGYCWKKRKDGKNIREDHMKLKVQGLECIYGSYVHSDILPTFHRRCYWLLQNPDIVLVHYLNVPYPDNTKVKIPVMPPCTVGKKEWTKEELVDQLRPMFSTGQPGEESEQMIDERVEALVKHLIEYHENRDKFAKQKCEKTCDKQCTHSSLVKIPHHGEPNIMLDSSQFTHTQCSNKHPCKAAQTRTTASSQEKDRIAAEQANRNNVVSSGSGRILVHHKGEELPCSTDIAQVPYILNLAGHIHVPTSSYLIVNGQTNPISTSAALETNCQPQCQSSTPNIVLAHQTHGINFSALKLEQSSQNLLHQTDLQQEALQQQKLLIQNGLQKSVNQCPDLSSVDQLVADSKHLCVPMQLTCDDNVSSCHDNSKCDKINLVPYLKTVTAEDVQEVVQSHQNSSLKDKSKDDPNGLDNYNLSASLASSDFDHLDLELPDIEKLYSFLGNSSDIQNSSQETMTSSVQVGHIQNESCLHSGHKMCDKCSVQRCQDQLHFQGEGHLQGQSCLETLAYNDQDTKAGILNNCKDIVCNRSSQTTDESLSAIQNRISGCDHGNQTVMEIVDFSPDWSYVEGGTKVLVIGPWSNPSVQYTCVIDDKPVPTTYIQPGVLRCYTPAHTTGCVSLQVSVDGKVISDTKTFEYRGRMYDNNTVSDTDWFSTDEHELKLLLIERLMELESRLMESQYRDGPVPSIKQIGPDLALSQDLQGKLSWYVKMFSAGTWSDMDSFPTANKYNMTLLHLSAALGYSRLLQAFIQWRSDNPCWFLDYEVDANCLDNNSCTAMMWACAKGNQQAAVILYHWNSETLKIPNKDGVFALDIAQSNGHFALHEELVKLQQSNSNSYIFSGEPFVTAGSVTTPNSFPDSPSKTLNYHTSTANNERDKDLFKSPQPLLSKTDDRLGALHIEIPSSSVLDGSDGKKILIRRQSDQMLPVNSARRKLSKRFSVDLPSDINNGRSSRAGSYDRPIREANSEPHLPMASTHPMTRGDNPMLSDHGRDITSPDIMMHMESMDQGKLNLDQLDILNLNLSNTMNSSTGLIKMDTDDLLSSVSGSPIIDVENISSDEEDPQGHSQSNRQSISTDNSDEAKQQMVTLAKQIIAAMPERIKSSPSRGDDIIIELTRERSGSYSSIPSQPSPHASSYEEDSGISTRMSDGLAFDEYRYPDISTPASSLSPDSTCLPSPYSPYSFTLDSPPPTTEDFTEYFNAPATFMEKDFSQLTLSDQEQRKLYEAAKVIQKTFRLYRDKQQLQQQQQKEIEAAVLIQKYYRRYKQYAYYKKMTQAAVLIQSQFRSYYAQKRFKKSRDAAVVIQNQYRTYKEHERLKKGGNKSVIIQQRYRSHYQRKNMKGQNADGHIVQIVPESADSSPDPNNACTDHTKHQDDERAPSSGKEEQQGE